MFELLNTFSIILTVVILAILAVAPNLFFVLFRENKEVTIGGALLVTIVLLVTGNALVLLAVGAAITFPLCARKGNK